MANQAINTAVVLDESQLAVVAVFVAIGAAFIGISRFLKAYRIHKIRRGLSEGERMAFDAALRAPPQPQQSRQKQPVSAQTRIYAERPLSGDLLEPVYEAAEKNAKTFRDYELTQAEKVVVGAYRASVALDDDSEGLEWAFVHWDEGDFTLIVEAANILGLSEIERVASLAVTLRAQYLDPQWNEVAEDDPNRKRVIDTIRQLEIAYKDAGGTKVIRSTAESYLDTHYTWATAPPPNS